MKKYFGLSKKLFLNYLEDTLYFLKLEFCKTQDFEERTLLCKRILQLRDFYDEKAYPKKA